MSDVLSPQSAGTGEPHLRLALLNAGGRDPEQVFADHAGKPGDFAVSHPPINYHAYAACTGGSFHASTKAAMDTTRPILLLLRRDLKSGWRALEELQAAGRTVAVTFKEAGAMQVAARLTKARDVELLTRIVRTANGCLAQTVWLTAFFHSLRGDDEQSVACIPTPYPVDDERWDYSIPNVERRGIFVGTREWDVPSRQHLAALLTVRRISEQTGERVSVVNPDGRAGAKLLTSLGFSSAPDALLRMIPGPLPYLDYLQTMAGHKLVFQLDRSGVPGQVAGDALLCRIPCIGGDGAVETIAFPELAGAQHTPAALASTAELLLQTPAELARVSSDAHARALKQLSFSVIATRLCAFYARIG